MSTRSITTSTSRTQRISRISTTALGVTAVALAFIGSSNAGAAAAASATLCEIKVVSVKAIDLQEDNQPTDEIFLRLGDTKTTQRTYFEGQKRNTLGDGKDAFTNPQRLRVVEHDASGNDVIDSARIPCENRSRTSILDDAAGDAIYEVKWDVDVLVP